MIEHEYPVPSYMADVFQAPEDWIEIPLIEEGGFPDIYGIDCEMVGFDATFAQCLAEDIFQCLTEGGKELARVCLINYISGKVIYDQLVKPETPITDYLTRWSGITEESMATATTTFAEVRAKMHGILSAKPTPVLAGHSLESDLRALKMSHPRCIDTAVIYHHPRGRPLKPGLAWLTKKWCHREIQNRGEGGHDPEEDARACLELLKKKVENGPGYGEFKTDQESIFERIARSTRSGGVKTAVVDHGTPASWHGAKATAAVACKTDEDVVNGVLEMLPNNHFVFGRFLELSDAYGCAFRSVNPSVKNDTYTNPGITGKAANETLVTEFADSGAELATDPVREAAAAAELNSRLSRIYDALPPRTAFIVFSGHSDPRQMAKLNSRKAAFEIAVRMGMPPTSGPNTWTTQDGRDLESEVEVAKRGFLFLCIKDA
jgi:RNA exonuclease 1